MMTMSMPWRSRRSRKLRCGGSGGARTDQSPVLQRTGRLGYHRTGEGCSEDPVIGNGDVDSPEKAKAILEQTGCDGVMIGRAAEGNPWIFREVVSYLENGTIPARPTNREKREMILRHAALQLEYKGEYTGVREMRKHLSWYTVGMPHSAHFRQTINTMEKMDELIRGVQEIFPDEV